MRRRYKSSLIFPCFTLTVFLLFYTINLASAQTTLSAEDIAEKALASTVYLEMKDTNEKTLGIGSGFFVKTNIIATNYHVIEGAAKGTAKLVGKSRTYKIEGITAFDKDNDLALLKVIAFGVRSLSLGDSDKVRIGETVYVAGNPKGLEGTFSDGIISSLRDELINQRLQMTAPISPGSSGGPVLNKKGEVIGVSFAGHRALDAQNLNFAIPSKHLKKLLEQSKSAKPLSQGRQSISAETYFQWGNSKYDLEDYVGAIADYTKAISLKPDAVGAYTNRGIAKANLGQYFDAITDFDTAIRLQPDLALVYYNRGFAKGKLKRYFAAIADYDKTIRLNPNYALAYFHRGNLKAVLGQYFDAITDYTNAIRLKPDYAAAYYLRGNTKTLLGQHSASITDYDEAVRIKPDYAEAYLQRGNAKSKLGKNFAAISDYDIAIHLKSDFAEAYIQRGNVKTYLKQYTAAIADYDKAIRLNPKDVIAYASRGGAKFKLRRTREAKQDYLTALGIAKRTGNKKVQTMIEKILQHIEAIQRLESIE